MLFSLSLSLILFRWIFFEYGLASSQINYEFVSVRYFIIHNCWVGWFISWLHLTINTVLYIIVLNRVTYTWRNNSGNNSYSTTKYKLTQKIHTICVILPDRRQMSRFEIYSIKHYKQVRKGYSKKSAIVTVVSCCFNGKTGLFVISPVLGLSKHFFPLL